MSKVKGIEKTACIGAGLIGSSWATLFSMYGYSVNLYDDDKRQLEASKDKIKANFEVYVNNGVIIEPDADEAMNRISYIEDFETAIKDVEFIQECVYEKLELKREVLAKADKYNSTALYCSSASAINISDISRESEYPERCIGAHPYNPPHLVPFVEITKWEKTNEDNVKLAYEFYESLKKVPVVLLKETPGFIANRLQGVYVKEAINLVTEGVCSIEDLDKASVYGLGLRYAIVGPFINGDLNGGDGGIVEYYRKYGAKMGLTEEFIEKTAPEGVEQEKANRPQKTGRTRKEIIEYRDKMLIEMLKLHDLI